MIKYVFFLEFMMTQFTSLFFFHANIHVLFQFLSLKGNRTLITFDNQIDTSFKVVMSFIFCSDNLPTVDWATDFFFDTNRSMLFKFIVCQFFIALTLNLQITQLHPQHSMQSWELINSLTSWTSLILSHPFTQTHFAKRVLAFRAFLWFK